MGQSTDAQLVYGVQLGDASEPEWPKEVNGVVCDDWDDATAALQGWTGEDSSFVWAREAAKSQPTFFEVKCHCCDEYRMHTLVLKEPGFEARRGYPKPIDPAELVTPEGADAFLMQAAKTLSEALGLSLVELPTPGWYLQSWWG